MTAGALLGEHHARVAGGRHSQATRRVLTLLALVVLAIYLVWAVQVLNSRVGYQIAVTGHPFVISDLFPRWLGSKALLAGQDPYSEAFREELHRQYYGHVMAPEEEMRLFRNVAEFFYPPYVALQLLPVLWLPFEVARWLISGLLIAGIGGAAWLWLRLLGVRSHRAGLLAAGGAVLFFPSLDLILLQQLTGLVFVELVGAFALATRRHYPWAGVLLALALIKPQGAVIPAGALLFWSLWRRDRWALIGTFGAVAAAQLAFAQVFVPGWLAEFLAASARYQRFNSISFWLPGQVMGSVWLGAVCIASPLCAALAVLWWRARVNEAGDLLVVRLMALTLAASVVLMPDISFYNKLFLVPALATGLHERRTGTLVERTLWRTTLVCVVAPIALLVFSATGFWLSGPLRQEAWRLPLLSLTDMVQAFFLLLPLVTVGTAAVHTTRGGHIAAYGETRSQNTRLRSRAARSGGEAHGAVPEAA